MGYSVRQYANAMHALLPQGLAWQWPVGGFGDGLVLATARELARIGADAELVLLDAINLHRPGRIGFLLSDYQAVADAATRHIQRQPLAAGFGAGDNAWSSAPIFPLLAQVVVEPSPSPLAAGFGAGALAWSPASRYYLRVSFDRSLSDFKQAHVYLFVIDTPILEI